ncbi:MAG: CRISPR-associated endonuclease Cas1 [Rhodocyclaceae bacterium]|nr:CRISPR-associated endonuclease Cas1 [Rhodocyclaceae bacterium]
MTSLFVDRRGVELELEGDAIVFRENDVRIGTVPVMPLTRVFLRGDVRLSAALLGRLGERGVGVVVLSGRQGKPSLLLARPHNDASRRVEQIRKSLDAGFCLDFARNLIERKIDRQAEWFDELRASDMQARYELTHAMQLLKEHRTRVPCAASLGSLRGVEGSAAACYFDGLKAIVPDSLHFKSRNRRPPRDPFNALLSLTYTLAHAELAIALFGAGFDPYVGFYHQLDFGRESLASDLLEAVRPLADRFALRLVRKQTLTADDFSTTESGCLLGKAGRARYYTAYEEYSEVLRAGIQSEVESLAERVGAALEAPAFEEGEAVETA